MKVNGKLGLWLFTWCKLNLIWEKRNVHGKLPFYTRFLVWRAIKSSVYLIFLHRKCWDQSLTEYQTAINILNWQRMLSFDTLKYCLSTYSYTYATVSVKHQIRLTAYPRPRNSCCCYNRGIYLTRREWNAKLVGVFKINCINIDNLIKLSLAQFYF